MSGFKLLGIKTKDRVGFSKKPDVMDYLKVLKDNTYYPFYSNYKLSKDGGVLTRESVNKIDLYSSEENDLKINISAIVGKNGSGKSTLLELLYLASYNLGCNYDLLEDWEPSEIEEFDENCKPIKNGKDITCESINLNFDILFEKNNEFYSLQFRGAKIKLHVGSEEEENKFYFGIKNLLKLDDKKELSQLFYSIAINYSIYGLNSNILGKWIKPLFHKNDGYKTPLVIGPMRIEGNFDINDEIEFASYRLLHNLLLEKKNKKTDEEIFISDNQYVKCIRFKINEKKNLSNKIKSTNYPGIAGESNGLKLILDLQEIFFKENWIAELILAEGNLPFQLQISNYIIRKVEKISKTYDEYKEGYIDGGDNTEFLTRLKTDGSHITFKLKQAINFLRLSSDVYNGENPWLPLKIEKDNIDFSLDELLIWMKCEKEDDLITLIPPSIFSFDIILSDKTEISVSNSKPSFNGLSSGEQQMIHSIQTVLYHLYNIQSVHKSNDERLSYEYINVIFDEIELYFHPDYQRKFISELLKSIKRQGFNNKVGIKALNIVFSTHSPFILSDIPNQNILRLIKGEPKESNPMEQTFGANIYDLLDNEFFMENGFIGEHAMFKIKEVLDYIASKKYDETKHDYFLELTNIIGDEIINQKLNQLLYDLYISSIDENQRKIIQLKLKQKQIEEQLKKLEE
ncbi:AAA family ATPase [Polaribacter sp. NJDZ03]|uniref:AAA family ATPase n=1 Tax=Polaribacter sp. NJDZ03 TaxID=2855841 RepID=UPI001C4A28F5|nr:AAA family ATPase [Polaribacter sp. NJDZ03]